MPQFVIDRPFVLTLQQDTRVHPYLGSGISTVCSTFHWAPDWQLFAAILEGMLTGIIFVEAVTHVFCRRRIEQVLEGVLDLLGWRAGKVHGTAYLPKLLDETPGGVAS